MVEFKTLSKFRFGKIIAHFYIDKESHIEWSIYPVDKENKFVFPKYQRVTYSLIQAKIWQDAYDKNFSNGMTMFNSETARKMTFVKQETKSSNNKFLVITTLKDQHGNRYLQNVEWIKSSQRLLLWSEFKNCESKEVCLEYLTSFVINSLSPFSSENVTQNLEVIRMRSKWAMEGRIEQNKIEEYDLEESWKASGIALLQFGQNGTMPVRSFFPLLALKDERENVTWLAELDARASWQMNLARIDDRLVMFGGLPDRDNGHWYKKVKPGEIYKTPIAYLTVGHGDFFTVSHKLQKKIKKDSLPIIYNEWGTTWGHPSEKIVSQTLSVLRKHAVKYYVIDAGWYYSKDPDFNRCLGDWVVNWKTFPNGLKRITEEIHKAGLKAGIWYEFEGLGDLCKLYNETKFLATRNGWPVTTMKRRFLDLRRQDVKKYIDKVLINPLIENHFDYLKIDYNDSLGIGVDSTDSPAQGIQDVITETLSIFKKLHKKIPNLEIESCSSGGHRLVPPFIDNSEFSSFSDAHETKSIPIIAANELNILPASKNLIWCVVHPEDKNKDLEYHLLASFIGRICLSGNICELSNSQWKIIDRGFDFYQKNAKLISGGFPFRFGPEISTYCNPIGYQIVGFSDKREINKSRNMLIIIHQFGKNSTTKVKLPIDLKHWRIKNCFGNKQIIINLKNSLITLSKTDFSAIGMTLEKNII